MRIVLYAVLGAILLAILGGLAAFVRWRSRARRRLLNASAIVQTVCGPIDCAFAGPDDGPPVLVLHGGLGGWDQGMMLAEDLHLTHEVRVIAPSRPGYLRTPLVAGATTDDAAEAMIALLDELGISRAFVVGLSGGGPTAVAIATRHRQRIRALIMICAISHRHVQPAITTETFFGQLLFSKSVRGCSIFPAGCSCN
jgi:pimeloyl-ACP methyl ester carboxylesterase